MLARATFEILRAVPVAEVRVTARVARPGRSVELLEGELSAGDEPVMLVRAWRVKASPAPDVEPRRPAAAAAGRGDAAPAGDGDFGYGHAVELRFAAGGWWQRRPATVWTRMRCRWWPARSRPASSACSPSPTPATASRPSSRSTEWLFINTELTVHFRRPARGEWVCLDAETSIASGGAGLARSVLSDDEGVVAQGAQALLVAPRGG